jgi:hypothetical protein
MAANPAALAALAERVESAQGPDRELDAKIVAAIGSVAIPWHHCGVAVAQWREPSGVEGAGGVSTASRYVPLYTASLDAAVALVPIGWERGFSHDPPHQAVGRANKWGEHSIEARAATPALALCAAALRAIATDARDA